MVCDERASMRAFRLREIPGGSAVFFLPRAGSKWVSITHHGEKISAIDVGKGRPASSRERRAVAVGVRVRATLLRIICDLAY